MMSIFQIPFRRIYKKEDTDKTPKTERHYRCPTDETAVELVQSWLYPVTGPLSTALLNVVEILILM